MTVDQYLCNYKFSATIAYHILLVSFVVCSFSVFCCFSVTILCHIFLMVFFFFFFCELSARIGCHLLLISFVVWEFSATIVYHLLLMSFVDNILPYIIVPFCCSLHSLHQNRAIHCWCPLLFVNYLNVIVIFNIPCHCIPGKPIDAPFP